MALMRGNQSSFIRKEVGKWNDISPISLWNAPESRLASAAPAPMISLPKLAPALMILLPPASTNQLM